MIDLAMSHMGELPSSVNTSEWSMASLDHSFSNFFMQLPLVEVVYHSNRKVLSLLKIVLATQGLFNFSKKNNVGILHDVALNI